MMRSLLCLIEGAAVPKGVRKACTLSAPESGDGVETSRGAAYDTL